MILRVRTLDLRSCLSQSSINWYAEVQKSRVIVGMSSTSGRRWVMRIPTIPSFGSTHQDVPNAPSQPKRPGTATAVRGLYLAGDWIDTGLPATNESAVRSGHRAADAALADA